MYSYNSSHKVIIALLIVAWAVFQFSGRSEESNYFKNGQIKRTGEQVMNLNEGTWVWYYPNGTVQLKGNFHEGKRNGEWKRYDSTGVLISSSNYAENRINGLYVEYDVEGNIIEEHIYKNDTLIKKTKFD